jgi:hypothetical protein
MEFLLNKAVVELCLPTCETILMKTNLHQATSDLYVRGAAVGSNRKEDINFLGLC